MSTEHTLSFDWAGSEIDITIRMVHYGFSGVSGGPADGWEPSEAPEYEILSMCEAGVYSFNVEVDELSNDLIDLIDEELSMLLSEEDY